MRPTFVLQQHRSSHHFLVSHLILLLSLFLPSILHTLVLNNEGEMKCLFHLSFFPSFLFVRRTDTSLAALDV